MGDVAAASGAFTAASGAMPFADEKMTVDRDIYLCIPLYQVLGDEIGMFRDDQDGTPWSSAKLYLNVEGVSGLDSTQVVSKKLTMSLYFDNPNKDSMPVQCDELYEGCDDDWGDVGFTRRPQLGEANQPDDCPGPQPSDGDTILQVQAAPQTKTSSVYIALAGDTNLEILDMEYFGTHGYIPAWDSMHNAVAALKKHLYGTTTPTEYKYMAYNFELVEGKLYMRPDKFDNRMRKLFFPLPMHNTVTESGMQHVWRTKYMNKARWHAHVWKKSYEWDCTFMDSIRVIQVTCGTLRLGS